MFIESRELKLRHRIPVTKTSKYWEGLEEGIVYKTVCKECGKQYYPPRSECLCGGEVNWVKIEDDGIIEAFTVVHTIPSGFESCEQYTIAIARFGNVCVMGWAENVKVGDKVRIKTGRDESGIWKVYFEVM